MTDTNNNNSKSSGFGGTTVFVHKARFAKDPTFIPGQTPEQDRALFTLITNEGKDRTTVISTTAFGVAARIAALYCMTGKEVDVEGRLSSYTAPKGTVDGNGKEEVHTTMNLVVNGGGIKLGNDPSRVIEHILKQNIGAIMQGHVNRGLLPPQTNIAMLLNDFTVASVLLSKKEPMRNFDANQAALTGKFGYARVWSQERKFWDQNIQAAPVATTALPVLPANLEPNVMNVLQALMAQLAQAQAANAASAAAALATETVEATAEANTEDMNCEPFEANENVAPKAEVGEDAVPANADIPF